MKYSFSFVLSLVFSILISLDFPSLSGFYLICIICDAASYLALYRQRVASLWHPAVQQIPQTIKQNLLKSPHSQPADRAVGEATEQQSFLQSSLSFVICLPLPLFLLFSYHFSLSRSTLSCASYSSPPSFLSIFHLVRFSLLDFLIHEGFRFALLSYCKCLPGKRLADQL